MKVVVVANKIMHLPKLRAVDVIYNLVTTDSDMVFPYLGSGTEVWVGRQLRE